MFTIMVMKASATDARTSSSLLAWRWMYAKHGPSSHRLTTNAPSSITPRAATYSALSLLPQIICCQSIMTVNTLSIYIL